MFVFLVTKNDFREPPAECSHGCNNFICSLHLPYAVNFFYGMKALMNQNGYNWAIKSASLLLIPHNSLVKCSELLAASVDRELNLVRCFVSILE
jgi:hypothetical protein